MEASTVCKEFISSIISSGLFSTGWLFMEPYIGRVLKSTALFKEKKNLWT